MTAHCYLSFGKGTRVTYWLYCCNYSFILAWFGIKKHMFGMQIKITGSAPRAAKFAGFDDNKTVWYSLVISGGLAGPSWII